MTPLLALIAVASTIPALQAESPIDDSLRLPGRASREPSLPIEPGESLTLPLRVEATRLDRFATRPLIFERNDGQTDSEVSFVARGRGYSLFLSKDEAVMVLETAATREGAEPLGLRQPVAAFAQHHAAPTAPEDWRTPKPRGDTVPREETDSSRVVRMRLSGANPNAVIFGQQPQRAKANYFIGNDATRWRTNIAAYGRVKCVGVYPGIDLVYYGNEGRLEYDFVVAPGADPNQIALEFDGAEGPEIAGNGDLVMEVGGREVRWQRPLIYQEVNGRRVEIGGRYRVRTPVAAATHEATLARAIPSLQFVSFELASYDRALPLVIDPILVYSTYLGGSGTESGRAVALDRHGNVFVAGSTTSIDFPTEAALNDSYSGGAFRGDVFVAKLNPQGELLFATYLGGSDTDDYEDRVRIAVGSEGQCYVVGTTISQDFPVVNALQGTYGGGDRDGFVAAIKADGSALLFSTYLGGDQRDSALNITLGPKDDIFVVGNTASPDFPTTNAFQPALSSPSNGVQLRDGFITRLDASGQNIIYSTFFGQSAVSEHVAGIACDADGNAFVGVWVYSDFASTRQWLISKIRPDGSSRLFDRRVPSALSPQPMGYPLIALGMANRVVVAGETINPGLPSNNQPDSSMTLGYSDAYIAQFSAADGSYISAVYLGGSEADGASGVCVDAAGDIVLVGNAGPSFPVTDPLTSQHNPPTSAGVFVARLRSTDLGLTVSSMVGGPESEYASGISLDAEGNAWIVGTTDGQFPTVSAVQPDYGGATDAFLLKFSFGEKIKINRLGQTVTLSWPAQATNYVLETTPSLPALAWTTVTNTPTITANERSVQLPLTGNARFFRLRKL
jgi:hypothetical protein